MPRFLILLSPLLIWGCDVTSDRASTPAWAEQGAVAVFDYEPGPDSLRGFQGELLPGERKAAEMHIEASDNWRRTDRYVRWVTRGDGTSTPSPHRGNARFPLDDADIDIARDGLRVATSTACTGNGWTGGSSRTLYWIRVPQIAGTIQTFGNCSNGPGATIEASGRQTITVPAGTFDTLVLEDEAWGQREYWSWESGLIRLDILNEAGELRGQFVRSNAD